MCQNHRQMFTFAHFFFRFSCCAIAALDRIYIHLNSKQCKQFKSASEPHFILNWIIYKYSEKKSGGRGLTKNPQNDIAFELTPSHLLCFYIEMIVFMLILLFFSLHSLNLFPIPWLTHKHTHTQIDFHTLFSACTNAHIAWPKPPLNARMNTHKY